MPGKSRAVVSAEFDALTFRSIMDMKFVGSFLSVRQHPHFWDMRIVVTTPVEGGLDIQKTTLRPDRRVHLSQLAELVKKHIRQMGMLNATEIKVVARWVTDSEMSVWFRKRIQNGGIPVMTPEMDTSMGDSDLDVSLTM